MWSAPLQYVVVSERERAVASLRNTPELCSSPAGENYGVLQQWDTVCCIYPLYIRSKVFPCGSQPRT
ncbi:hypothetical protein PHYPO_G00240850 [Pangasianodon hypophthalmus]|uniref:Uncharacterized protein n=1 Tax=Pangasianodon hypophthalmus TaxID=310915 RepID=A0A5N5NFY2_PANHP|nr:hypothetical protein PHYPO_G00240850 [Pangasianodon hypophthalmus]